MLASKMVELRIFRYVRHAAIAGWRATTLPELVTATERKDNQEVIDGLKRLHKRGLMELRKWGEPAGFLPYVDASQDDDFFGRGGFELKITPEGREYSEALNDEAHTARALGRGHAISDTALENMAAISRALQYEMKSVTLPANMVDFRLSGTALESMAALSRTLQHEMKSVTLAANMFDFHRAFETMAQIRGSAMINFDTAALAKAVRAQEQYSAAVLRPFIDSYQNLSVKLAEVFQRQARDWSASLPLRGLQDALALQVSYAKAIESVNLELPLLVRAQWSDDVLAGRFGLIQEALKNVSAFQRLRESIAAEFKSLDHGHVSMEPLTLAGHFVFDYGRFIHRLPPPIPIEGEEKLAATLRYREEEVPAKLQKALEQFDPRLAALHRLARKNAAQADAAGFRTAMLALRELYTDVLHRLAPDEEVKRTPLWEKNRDQSRSRPTRRMRIEFIMGAPTAQLNLLVQFDESFGEVHKFAHTFSDNLEVVRVYLSLLENCIYLLLVCARSRG